MNRVEELETRELRYFVAVAEELSFGGAAERLGMAQPPLSRAIRQLETRLGVRLLERTTRQVALTTAGEVLLEQARGALDAVAAAGRRARRAGQPEPELVVAVKAGGDPGNLQEIVAAYETGGAHPPARVVVGAWGEQTAMLRDGRADVALLRTPFDQRGLDFELLLTEPRVAVLPATHRLASRRRLRLADLAGEPTPYWPGVDAAADAYWSARDPGSHGDGPGPPPLTAAGPPPADRPVVGDVAQILQVVALGQAVAFLPASTIRQYTREDVVFRPVAGLSPSTVAVVWPETSRSLAVAAFVRAATEVTYRSREGAATQPDGHDPRPARSAAVADPADGARERLGERLAQAGLLVPEGRPRRQRPDPRAVARARREAGRGTSLSDLVGEDRG